MFCVMFGIRWYFFKAKSKCIFYHSERVKVIKTKQCHNLKYINSDVQIYCFSEIPRNFCYFYPVIHLSDSYSTNKLHHCVMLSLVSADVCFKYVWSMNHPGNHHLNVLNFYLDSLEQFNLIILNIKTYWSITVRKQL